MIIYGAIDVVGLIAMWLLDRTDPLAFAFSSIIVFQANAAYLQRQTNRGRQNSLIGYSVVGLFALILTILYRWLNEAERPFILAEGVMILAGILATILQRRRPAQQITAQQQLNANIARAARPGFILRNIWPISRFFPNRPTNTP